MSGQFLSSVPILIDELKAGRSILLLDDSDRENEADFVFPAQIVTAEMINYFNCMSSGGVLCLALSFERACALDVKLASPSRYFDSYNSTAFAISIEAAEGITTGASTLERAHTMRIAAASNAKASDLIQPGHVFPLVARAGGLLSRLGHTETSTDLVRMAGFSSAALICELLDKDGSMARIERIRYIATKHQVAVGSVKAVFQYRCQTENCIDLIYSATISTQFGRFTKYIFQLHGTAILHVAFIRDAISLESGADINVYFAKSQTYIGPLSVIDDFQQDNKYFNNQMHADIDVIIAVLPTVEQQYQFLLGNMIEASSASYVASGIAYQILQYFGIDRVCMFGDKDYYQDLYSYKLAELHGCITDNL